MPQDLTYSAPVGCVNLLAEGYEILPCDDCLPWHAEVVHDQEDGTVLVCERHAVDCPALTELIT